MQIYTIKAKHTYYGGVPMENFYEIKKNADFFVIQRKSNQFTMLELDRGLYSQIHQYKHAIIAELATGGYRLYLPSTAYDFSLHQYDVNNQPLISVTFNINISEYLTYHDIFAFKKDSDWKFLLLHNFEMELELEEDIAYSLKKRLSELPTIPCQADTPAFFKEEFETLYHSERSEDKHHLAVFHADQDYLINAQEHEIPLYDPGIQINCLGVITMLSGGDGRFFKATYAEGESWYHNQYFDGITYGSIESMKDDEYPAIYPSKDFSGYWKKNHNGLILALAFLSNVDSTSFKLHLPFPAKEVKFVKNINQVNLLDGSDTPKPAILWKITSATGEVLFLLVSGNIYVTLSSQDFTN